MDDVCKLVTKTYSADSIGQKIASETLSQVFCTISSVSRREFFDAGQSGIRPEIVITTPSVNYDGQDELEVNSVRYTIYRSYSDGEKVELYCTRKI